MSRQLFRRHMRQLSCLALLYFYFFLFMGWIMTVEAAGGDAPATAGTAKATASATVTATTTETGPAITVRRVFAVTEEPEKIISLYLLGVADLAAGQGEPGPVQPGTAQPDVIAASWEVTTIGWFPSWIITFRSERGIIPAHHALQTGLRVMPEKGHRYEAALSYDAAAGYLSFRLLDLTDNTILADGFWTVNRCPAEKLYAVDENNAVLPADPWFAPVGTKWDIGTMENTLSGFIPLSKFEPSGNMHIRLLAAGPLPGEYQVLSSSGKKLLTIDGQTLTAGENFFTIPFTELSIGRSHLELQYIYQGRIGFSDTRSFVGGKIVVSLDTVHVELNPATQELVSNIKIQSQSSLRNVALRLHVEFQSLSWDNEKADYVVTPHTSTTVDLGHIPEIPAGTITLPVAVKVPAQPGLWQVGFSVTADPEITTQTVKSAVRYSTQIWQVLDKENLTVTADRKDALYKVGETATFIIRLTQDGQPLDGVGVQWQLVNDGNFLIRKGSAVIKDGYAYVTGTLDQPGFIQLAVTYKAGDKEIIVRAGAGFDPLNIRASLPPPEDFDAFWTAKKAELAKIPMEPKLTQVASRSGINIYDVQVRAWGERPVSGYLAVPQGAKPGSLPAILLLHGAGVTNSNMSRAIQWASEGMLAFDINAHGLPNGQPASYYEELAQGELKGYQFRGRESRDDFYFLGMFLRVLRAIDYLASRPEWDGRTLILYGTSQGGAQSFAGAGLDSRVTLFVAGVPGMADLTGRQLPERLAGWPGVNLTVSPVRSVQDNIDKTIRYFDAANFATRVGAEAVLTVGFIDTTCPPTTVYAAYNNINSKKSIFNDVTAPHTNTPEATAFMREAVLRHVAEMRRVSE